jgi:hypothetical protein
MVMVELTEDQEKGFEILTRTLRRKFPYIKSLKLSKSSMFHIWIQFEVEFFSFLTYYNVKPNNYYLKYGVNGIEDYFKYSPTGNYPFVMVDNDLIDEFGNEFNKNFIKTINILYESLPEKYIKYKEDWYEKSPIELGIDSFYIVVDESKETPTLRDMLDPEYENARQILFKTKSPD